MSNDLVKRLHEEGLGWGIGPSILCAAAASEITRLRAELAAEQQNALNLLNAVGLLQSDLKQARAELAAAIHEKENRILERDEAESLLAKARAELAARDELLKEAREALEFCKEYFDGDVAIVEDAIARIDAAPKGSTRKTGESNA